MSLATAYFVAIREKKILIGQFLVATSKLSFLTRPSHALPNANGNLKHMYIESPQSYIKLSQYYYNTNAH